MNQRKADAALGAIKQAHRTELAEYSDERFEAEGPKIVRGYYRDDDWAVVWEAGPFEWTLAFKNQHEDPAGTFCEPINEHAMGVYDAN